MISITRRYRFSASHRLHSPLLSESENATLFGKCNNPFGHGHNYTLCVTLAGEVDERTGLLLNIGDLDRLIQEKVLDVFSHSNINTDVPEFADLIPTTENIALVIAGRLHESWSKYLREQVRLQRVHVQETERNGFDLVMPAGWTIGVSQKEDVLVHA